MTYDAAVLGNSPLVYWKLNETTGTVAVDSSGNARDGAYTNGAHTGASLVSGLTPSAQLTDDRVSIADAAWQDTATWTVEVWFASTDTASGVGLACRDSGGADRHWNIHLNHGATGKIGVRVWNGSTYLDFATTTATYNDGARHHVVTTCDGSTLRLYIDGTEVGTGTAVSGLTSTLASDIRVGQHSGQTGITPADMAAFAYYGSVLSGAAVSANYAEGIAPPPLTVLASPMLARPQLPPVVVSFPVPLLVAAPPMLARPRLGAAVPFITPPVTVLAAPMLARPRVGAATAPVPVNVSVGRFTLDPSQGWGFDLGTRIALSTLEPDDAPGSTVTQVSETYDDPTVVDGRPT